MRKNQDKRERKAERTEGCAVRASSGSIQGGVQRRRGSLSLPQVLQLDNGGCRPMQSRTTACLSPPSFNAEHDRSHRDGGAPTSGLDENSPRECKDAVRQLWDNPNLLLPQSMHNQAGGARSVEKARGQGGQRTLAEPPS
jgi:hypothetical protein